MNKTIPADELLLAEMIANVEASGLTYGKGTYKNDNCVCAVGALTCSPKTLKSSFNYAFLGWFVTEKRIRETIGSDHASTNVILSSDGEEVDGPGCDLGYAYRGYFLDGGEV